MGWSAGKLGEWYADLPAKDSYFNNDKGYWQESWFDQHQRLVRALSAQKGRAAVSISGDMHASAGSAITSSGDLDLSSNPVHTILPGTVGTGTAGWPSSSQNRGIAPFHPKVLKAQNLARVQGGDKTSHWNAGVVLSVAA